jgi:hypothetical protein
MISIGIEQRDSLSSILFNVIIDKIIKEVKDVVRGYKIRNKEIKIFYYANNIVIIKKEDNLQIFLYRFELKMKK